MAVGAARNSFGRRIGSIVERIPGIARVTETVMADFSPGSMPIFLSLEVLVGKT